MIIITGDTHGLHDIDKLYQLKRMGLTYDDYLIILGDAGIIWRNDGRDDLVFKWYKKNVPCSVAFIDGNHENHDAINSMEVEQWNGGNIHRINKQIIHLMRGQVFTIDNKKMFTMGGGLSVDKAWRTEGVSWWSREMPSDEEYALADRVLKDNDYRVDYILTHDCPELFLEDVVTNFSKMEPNELNYYLNDIYKNTDFRKWYFAHHHNDYILNEKCRCLYQDIVEIR